MQQHFSREMEAMISSVSLLIKEKTEVTVHGAALLEPQVPSENVVAAGICRIRMRSHGKFHYWAHMREQ